MEENELEKKKRILSIIKKEFHETVNWNIDTINWTKDNEKFEIWVMNAELKIKPNRLKEILRVYSIWADFFPGEPIKYENLNRQEQIGIVGLINRVCN